MKMYKLGRYKQTDRMSDLICENYPMLLVLSRFGISLGFGDKTIGEVCEDSGVDTKTFLTIVNLLLDDHTTAEQIDPSLSVEALVSYLQNSHSYFLDFRLPLIRRKLIEAIDCGHSDVSFAIMRYFDQYVAEVRKHMNYEETTVFYQLQAAEVDLAVTFDGILNGVAGLGEGGRIQDHYVIFLPLCFQLRQ